jgi:dCMP deaminase
MRALHAEQNALLHAAKIGIPCEGSTIYVTCQPCNNCAKMLINAGVTRVIYEGDYPDEFSKELFRDSKMEVLRYREDRLEQVDLGS